MGWIEVAEEPARLAAASAEQRLPEQAIEEFPIQPVEYFRQIVACALGSGDELAAADLPHQLHLLTDFPAVEIQPVAMIISARYGPAVEFTEQDIGQRLEYRGGRAFEDIGYLHGQPPVFQAY